MDPVFSLPQKSETAIVITAAHADSIVVLIESDHRSDDKIEHSWINQNASSWFPNTKAAARQFGLRSDRTKRHLRLAAQNRNENALVCAPGTFDDFACIYLVLHRQEARYRLA